MYYVQGLKSLVFAVTCLVKYDQRNPVSLNHPPYYTQMEDLYQSVNQVCQDLVTAELVSFPSLECSVVQCILKLEFLEKMATVVHLWARLEMLVVEG